MLAIEVGKNIITGIAGTSPKGGVLILTDPIYTAGDGPNQERWVCYANVLGSLCLIEVRPKAFEDVYA